MEVKSENDESIGHRWLAHELLARPRNLEVHNSKPSHYQYFLHYIRLVEYSHSLCGGTVLSPLEYRPNYLRRPIPMLSIMVMKLELIEKTKYASARDRKIT